VDLERRSHVTRNVAGEKILERFTRQEGDRGIRLRRNVRIRVIAEHDEQGDLLLRGTSQQAAGGEEADVPRGLTPEKQLDERRTVARIHAMWALAGGECQPNLADGVSKRLFPASRK
jgi:hypothetical protein